MSLDGLRGLGRVAAVAPDIDALRTRELGATGLGSDWLLLVIFSQSTMMSGVGVETQVSPGVAHSGGQAGLAAAAAFAKHVVG